MMDHVYEQSKEDRQDKSSGGECEQKDEGSYYYDDGTNYEIYRDDEDEEPATQNEHN